MNWLKRLFCKHYKVIFVRNIYGDEIIEYGYKRSIWKCDKCGAIVPSDHLAHPGEDMSDLSALRGIQGVGL